MLRGKGVEKPSGKKDKEINPGILNIFFIFSNYWISFVNL
jgi:hypothetical protein